LDEMHEVFDINTTQTHLVVIDGASRINSKHRIKVFLVD